MTFQYASDLHLEFPKNAEFIRKHPLQPSASFLILAGDIVPFALIERFRDFWDFLSDHFEQTYWIPGNHEYYKSDLADWPLSFHRYIRPNVHLLNNESITLEDTRFIFSTMWSHIHTLNQRFVERVLADFRVIANGGKRLTADHFNQMHQDCLGFLKQEAHWHDNHKKVVVTHHVPTLMKYPARYKGDVLNDGFAVELFDWISQSQPDAWIFGHHHDNTTPFKIGQTNLLTNQLGYVLRGEHTEFDRKKVCSV